MSDIFSNLAALSLGSRVGMQPLIPPLFASASQLLSDVTLSSFNDQPTVKEEDSLFSIAPSIVVDRSTDRSEMEQPSEEVITTEKRMIPLDLVPQDVPQEAISMVSLRNLLYYQHLMSDRMEPVTHLSQSPTPAPTFDESLSEELLSTAFPQDNSKRDDVSHTSPEYQIKFDGVPLPQSMQSQKATLPSTGNTEMPYSSIRHDDQKRTEEKLLQLHTTPTNYEPQHTSQKDHPVIPTGNASQFQYPLPSSDKPAVPQLIQPALPVSLQSGAQSEHIANIDGVLDELSSTLAQPHVQFTGIPVSMNRSIMSIADIPDSTDSASKPKQQMTGDGQSRTRLEAAPQPLSGLDASTIKPLLDQHTVAKEQKELLQAVQAAAPSNVPQSVKARFIVPVVPAEPISNNSASHLSNVQDALHSPRDSSKQEAHRAEAEDEIRPIHITIGRVVVRAIPQAQPTPIQKRVLRPAQSLNEYLKQRERGSQ